MEEKIMKLVRRNNPMFPDLFDDFFTRELNLGNNNSSIPAANIKETENEYQIELAIPGADKKDIHINLDHEVLTISTEKKEEHEEKNKDYTRKEFSYNSFCRSFTLPENEVEGEKIDAKYRDGILYIMVPKREEAKPKPVKEIKIN